MRYDIGVTRLYWYVNGYIQLTSQLTTQLRRMPYVSDCEESIHLELYKITNTSLRITVRIPSCLHFTRAFILTSAFSSYSIKFSYSSFRRSANSTCTFLMELRLSPTSIWVGWMCCAARNALASSRFRCVLSMASDCSGGKRRVRSERARWSRFVSASITGGREDKGECRWVVRSVRGDDDIRWMDGRTQVHKEWSNTF